MSKLKLVPYGDIGHVASRKTKWHVPRDAPKSVDDLTFTSRDSMGRICWWDVTPPKTDYWHVHQVLGRAYAFELLDLINNPEAEVHDSERGNVHILAYIADALHRWQPTECPWAREPMTNGFFGVISEFLLTGTADR